MSNIDKRALREAAEKASTDNHTQDEWFHYLRCSTPETVLALLDEMGAKDKRIAELEAREVNGRFPLPKDTSQGWKIDPEFISKIQDAIGYDEECQCWEGSPSMEMVEAVLIAAAAIKMDERG